MLPGFLASYLPGPPPDAPGRLEVLAEVASWTPDDAAAVRDHLRGLGAEPRVYPADPRCRRVSRAWCRDALTDVVVEGIEHLEAARVGSVLLVGNHVSYVDTTATDAALARVTGSDLADRLVALAGPKVYADLFRRFASACLSTLPVPQSNRLEHTARTSARTLAALVRQSLDQTAALAREGALPLLYAEGSRTRTGRLGPFVKGAARYLACAERVVPVAVVGTDRLMPLEEALITPGPVKIRFGPGIVVRDPKKDLARVHEALTDLLPAHARPEPGAPAVV